MAIRYFFLTVFICFVTVQGLSLEEKDDKHLQRNARQLYPFKRNEGEKRDHGNSWERDDVVKSRDQGNSRERDDVVKSRDQGLIWKRDDVVKSRDQGLIWKRDDVVKSRDQGVKRDQGGFIWKRNDGEKRSMDNYLNRKMTKMLAKLGKVFSKAELKAFLLGMKAQKAMDAYRKGKKVKTLKGLLQANSAKTF